MAGELYTPCSETSCRAELDESAGHDLRAEEERHAPEHAVRPALERGREHPARTAADPESARAGEVAAELGEGLEAEIAHRHSRRGRRPTNEAPLGSVTPAGGAGLAAGTAKPTTAETKPRFPPE